MGSIRHLYTTGDNDPQIEPESYYRHYYYCDACGSFALERWTTPETPRDLGPPRRRLGIAAALTAALAFVAAWEMVGFPLSPALFALAVTGGAAGLAFYTWSFKAVWRMGLLYPWRLRFFRGSLLVLAVLGVAQLLVTDFYFTPVAVLVVAGVTTVALLIWRASLAAIDEVHGLRCTACGARYPPDSKLVRDLDANPRGFTVDDVPRPLGSSPYEIGASAPTPPAPLPRSRLPE